MSDEVRQPSVPPVSGNPSESQSASTEASSDAQGGAPSNVGDGNELAKTAAGTSDHASPPAPKRSPVEAAISAPPDVAVSSPELPPDARVPEFQGPRPNSAPPPQLRISSSFPPRPSAPDIEVHGIVTVQGSDEPPPPAEDDAQDVDLSEIEQDTAEASALEEEEVDLSEIEASKTDESAGHGPRPEAPAMGASLDPASFGVVTRSDPATGKGDGSSIEAAVVQAAHSIPAAARESGPPPPTVEQADDAEPLADEDVAPVRDTPSPGALPSVPPPSEPTIRDISVTDVEAPKPPPPPSRSKPPRTRQAKPPQVADESPRAEAKTESQDTTSEPAVAPEVSAPASDVAPPTSVPAPTSSDSEIPVSRRGPPPRKKRRPPKPPSARAVKSALAPPKFDGTQRKRARVWWEELFTDDFARAIPPLTEGEISKEAQFIEESLGVSASGVILDLACGTGQHAVEMARRGYNLVGFDLSVSQLAEASELAQRQKLKINFVQGDMRDMTLENMFDGVYCWNTSFGYFEEEKNVAVVQNVFRALKSGGHFLLDIINRDFVAEQQPNQNWFEGDGCVCMDDMSVDFITSRLRVKRTVMLDDGRNRECTYSIRLYGLHEVGKLLHDVGFKVLQASGHPALPGVFFGATSPRIIVLAAKP